MSDRCLDASCLKVSHVVLAHRRLAQGKEIALVTSNVQTICKNRMGYFDGHDHFCCSDEPARAMMAIQENFGAKINWMGDPCALKAFAWRGLNCSFSPAYPARITALNLSSFGLAGTISTNFGDLDKLQYLDLSSNGLHGAIPYDLLQKSQNGSLSLR